MSASLTPPSSMPDMHGVSALFARFVLEITAEEPKEKHQLLMLNKDRNLSD